jgi:hypothetical protein
MVHVSIVEVIGYINIGVRGVNLMKTYRVFECANHRFTWAGGTVINIIFICDDGREFIADRLEFFDVRNDKMVMDLCLEWLEDNDLIEEAAYYNIL